jgi:hypothetical protein
MYRLSTKYRFPRRKLTLFDGKSAGNCHRIESHHFFWRKEMAFFVPADMFPTSVSDAFVGKPSLFHLTDAAVPAPFSSAGEPFDSFGRSSVTPEKFQWKKELIEELKALPPPREYRGMSTLKFAGKVAPELETLVLKYMKDCPRLGESLTGEELHHLFANDRTLPSAVKWVAVMAWGRQRPKHAKRTWNCKHVLIPIIDALPMLSRRDAFEMFHRAQCLGNLKGLRASYYTKLIRFLGGQVAYIADQWTSKSFQLCNALNWQGGHFRPSYKAFPRLANSAGTTLHDDFDANGYEAYCCLLDELAALLGLNEVKEAERRLFSNRTHPWRERVRKAWTNRKCDSVSSLLTDSKVQ